MEIFLLTLAKGNWKKLEVTVSRDFSQIVSPNIVQTLVVNQALTTWYIEVKSVVVYVRRALV